MSRLLYHEKSVSFFVAFWIFFFVFGVSSYHATPLTLSEVFNLAVSYNETLSLQHEAIGIVQTQYRQARGISLPYVAVAGSETLQDTSGVTQGSGASSTFTNSRKQEYKILAKQTLYSGNQDKDTLLAFDALIRKEKIGLKKAKRVLYQDVVDVYFQALLIQKDLASVQENIDLMNARIKELNNRVRIGKSRQSEVLSAESQLANLESQKEASLGDLQNTVIILSNLIGTSMKDIQFVEPTPTLPVDLSEGTFYKKISNHSDIQSLIEDENYYEYSRLSAVHSNRPKVNVGANYYLERTKFLSPINWDMSLLLEIPLYQGDINKASAEEYSGKKRRISLSMRQTLRALQLQIAGDLAVQDSLVKQKKSLDLAYKKAKDSYNSYVEEYRLGLVNNLDVIQSSTHVLDIKHRLDKADLMIKRNTIQLAIDCEELP